MEGEQKQHDFCPNKGETFLLLVAEPSLTLDLRTELGTGESLSPLASDLASEEEEERREAEQGGSTWARKQGVARILSLSLFSTVSEPRLAPTPPTLGPILHSGSGRCVGETTFKFSKF